MVQVAAGGKSSVIEGSVNPNLIPLWAYDFTVMALFLLTAFITRLPTFLRSVMDWDESLYFLMAQQWFAGHLPYTTLWDNKPIGIYTIFLAFQWIFGRNVLSIRIATVIFVAVTAFIVFKLVQVIGARERHGVNKAALAAGVAYLICSVSNDGLAANTELFMIAFTCSAAWCALSIKFCAQRPALKGFCTGLLLGIAFMTKYVMVFEVPAVVFGLLFVSLVVPKKAIRRTCLAGFAGGAIPLLLTALSYLHAGEFHNWANASILANFRREGVAFQPLTTALLVRLAKWLPLYTAALVVFVSTLRRPQPDFPMFLTLWLLGGALGVISAKSFYSHYFLQLLPPLCVSLGWVLLRDFSALCNWPTIAGILFIPIASALITLGIALAPVMTIQDGARFHQDTPALIAADLINTPQETGLKLYVFDYEPIIYALADTKLPTRYAYPAFVTTCILSHIAKVQPQSELRHILSKLPQFIVMGRKPVTDLPVDPAVYADMRNALTARYVTWKHYGDATVYQLRPAPLAPLPPEVSGGCKN
ncbi:glycosyltransferase family 39 protein [Acidocella sp. KAb 2-4]|uniref:ArnT family glycosyltransferase n=1 Tax=Acidocella sp. KAb 2-4 TaxID=2885158 RepID=UPI001D0677F9|nr:glycosyltransferase family 39 protein [Acidocella sp. KAb 2-4]MCB5944961.1 glycosyltransferase family 39 protein [Acidocella sp. KAb 2-4]